MFERPVRLQTDGSVTQTGLPVSYFIYSPIPEVKFLHQCSCSLFCKVCFQSERLVGSCPSHLSNSYTSSLWRRLSVINVFSQVEHYFPCSLNWLWGVKSVECPFNLQDSPLLPVCIIYSAPALLNRQWLDAEWDGNKQQRLPTFTLKRSGHFLLNFPSFFKHVSSGCNAQRCSFSTPTFSVINMKSLYHYVFCSSTKFV